MALTFVVRPEKRKTPPNRTGSVNQSDSEVQTEPQGKLSTTYTERLK